MCGEKGYYPIIRVTIQGSPPRVRGKDALIALATAHTGITPACAGKSIIMFISVYVNRDHPRVCGEKRVLMAFSELIKGSPPRVRGKECPFPPAGPQPGITPACAGKRLKKAHKIKDFDPVPIRFHLVFRRFERWCSNLPTPDGNVPV